MLPIDSLKDRFLETFSTLRPGGRLVLTAPTGSGKSTRVPLWCRQAQEGKVLVLEPRRVAARTLAGWVAKGLDSSVGKEVGYSVRFESRHGPETTILFVTPGVARRLLVDGTISEFSTVIFDEFHERSWETDALMALLAAQKKGPRLVIMSATLMAEALRERYKAELLQAEGRSFPVEMDYWSGGPEFTIPSARQLVERTVKAVRKEWEKSSEGSLLVFLPGLSSMREVASGLGKLPTVLLHGTFGQKEQERAFDQSFRKIVLATNVAESSLTIPDVVTVVDSGVERRQIHQSGYVALATVPIARSSADQRAGRAGRVSAGRCLRLWEESAGMELSKPPDICRMELDDLVLFFSALPAGLDSPAEWVDAPPDFAWERAKRRLLEAELITPEGKISKLGKAVQRLPVEQDWARVIWQAPKDLRGDLCDLCALATARRSPIRNSRSEEILQARKDDWGEEPWARSLAVLRQGVPVKHGLEADALAMCRKVSRELRELVEADESESTARPHRDLQSHLVRYWSERVFLLRQGRNAWGNGSVECRLPRGEDLPEECVAAFFLQVNPVMGRRGLKVELQGRQGLPLRVSLLRKCGLGQPELSKIRWIKGELSARVRWVHAGRELGSEERLLSGRELRTGLAELAAQGRWKRELVERMKEERYYARLYQLLQGGEAEELPVLELMAERLKTLGVETCEELELLEDEDFLQPQVPAWELEKLQSDYPRIYSIGGISFAMEYEPSKRKVIMNSLSQSKGVKVKPQHLPRWNGWRVVLNERGRLTNLR